MQTESIRYLVRKASYFNDFIGDEIINGIEKQIVDYFEKYEIKYNKFPPNNLGLGAGGLAASFIMKILMLFPRIIDKWLGSIARESVNKHTPTIEIDLGVPYDRLIPKGGEIFEPGHAQAQLIIIAKGIVESLAKIYPDVNFMITTRVRYTKYNYDLVCHFGVLPVTDKEIAKFVHFIEGCSVKSHVYETAMLNNHGLIVHNKYIFNE